LTISSIFLESMETTFTSPGDIFSNGRKKLIHTVGVIAKTQFVATSNSPYTGIFKGSKNMLLRFSVAKQPDFTKVNAPYDNFTPGISLKWLRDGQPSANLVAMFTTSGQHSWNPFANDFTNTFYIPDDSGTPLKLLGLKFSTSTNYISSIGVKNIAAIDENGNSNFTPNYPFKLIFRPSAKAKANNFPDTFVESYMTQVQRMKAGDTIYEVFAIDQPGCAEIKIGDINMVTDFTSSRWGDETLFFRHSKIDGEDAEKGWAVYRDYFNVFGDTHGKVPTPKTNGCPFARLFQ